MICVWLKIAVPLHVLRFIVARVSLEGASRE